MEDPPPVPPKDSPYRSDMDIDRSATLKAPTSGSKRKRTTTEDLFNYGQTQEKELGTDAHTPKRTRSAAKITISQSDAEDETTPARQRNVRRKKGFRNLSNLNLRHAASQQAKESSDRESKFQEGSLTDKPSDKPPSAFTRFIRTHSGNVQRVDELMADYHEGVEDGKLEAGPSTGIAAKEQGKDEQENGAGLFKFGRNFATSFHPVTLWHKLWNETKEELKRADLAEAERKRRLKEEAEAQYARLQKTGELPIKTVRADEGISYDGEPHPAHSQTVKEQPSFYGQSGDDLTSQSGSEFPETVSKNRTLISRFTLKRPSLSNLKFGLKRTTSEMNLAGAAAANNRESSSSVSPAKVEYDQTTVRKQHKLNKRVSDLEGKLQQARRELDEAIANASPMPKFGSKYERFTPSMRSRRFAPGALPSLPSEGLLLVGGTSLSTPGETSDTGLPDFQGNGFAEDGDETIRPNGTRSYPPRADALFGLDPVVTDSPALAKAMACADLSDAQTPIVGSTFNAATNSDPTIPEQTDVKPNSSNGEGQAKVGKKKSKKRKSTNADPTFRPSEHTVDELNDSDLDINNTTSKKKRRSANGSALLNQHKKNAHTAEEADEKLLPRNSEDSAHSADELAGDEDMQEAMSVRHSMESQGQPLDPVYEEEEEMSVVALNEEPVHPTALATPARFTVRKRNPGVTNGNGLDEARSITAMAGITTPKSQRKRPISTPPNAGEAHIETSGKVDGRDAGLAGYSKVVSSTQVLAGARKEDFVWPDDVF
ncbi:hypothetical protein K431DRAFT_302121 [Polychaeton citri CBS 116435]|uniref:Uncharacterized protein n=1 Tax=Polychaeton citri CBS 116435 TaxID=1314669 RepID=A0A9P4QDZ8_9PEZI|nr:hypothetical protein K431DRAFT_302121 [Polychaeton citri CBS 116435]